MNPFWPPDFPWQPCVREVCEGAPIGSSFSKIDSGRTHAIGLQPDGTAICWGEQTYGKCDVPIGETFIDVSAGFAHSAGLRPDGTAVCWGWNVWGQCDPPEGETYTQISAGVSFTAGLKPDGTVSIWGSEINDSNIFDVPETGRVLFIDAEYNHIAALVELQDCDSDGILDPYELDCNADEIPDDCQELSDCDNDGILDLCEIADGNAIDLNSNGIDDLCDPDCDSNGVPDFVEIANGAFDCNVNSIPDSCDVQQDPSLDGCLRCAFWRHHRPQRQFHSRRMRMHRRHRHEWIGRFRRSRHGLERLGTLFPIMLGRHSC